MNLEARQRHWLVWRSVDSTTSYEVLERVLVVDADIEMVAQWHYTQRKQSRQAFHRSWRRQAGQTASKWEEKSKTAAERSGGLDLDLQWARILEIESVVVAEVEVEVAGEVEQLPILGCWDDNQPLIEGHSLVLLGTNVALSRVWQVQLAETQEKESSSIELTMTAQTDGKMVALVAVAFGKYTDDGCHWIGAHMVEARLAMK